MWGQVGGVAAPMQSTMALAWAAKSFTASMSTSLRS